MNVRSRRFGLAVLGVTLAATSAHAQFVPGAPDASGARVHAGPLYLNPSLSLTNVGVDTNLFNDPEAVQPKRDLAVTFVPQTDAFIRMGRTWLTGNLRQDLVWFRDYRDQRSANGSYRGGWLVPLNRLSLHLEGTYVRSRERPSPEIDVRAERRERGATLVAEIRALSRTFIGGRVDRRDVRFADQTLFAGEHLSDQLNRTRTSALLSIRHELTPLTSLAFEASQFKDDFTVAHDRDSQATQFAGGFRFDPSALLSGHALVGYRRFSPGDPLVPDYRGPTVSASLGYVARTSTRVTVDAGRDVEYSYDPLQPYYLMSGLTGTLTQRIGGPVDVQARGGVRTLAYRQRLSIALGSAGAPAATAAPAGRDDRVTLAGIGFGYRIGLTTRVAVEFERQRRTSPVALRSYEGNRYGLSMTWVP